MKQCPRCASELTEIDSVCPRCGLPITEHSPKNLKRAQKLAKKADKKRLKEQKKQEKLALYQVNTDFSEFKKKEYMNKKQAQDALEFELDENGEYDIDTSDVELIDKQTRELLAKREQQTYSVKKARGDYDPEKIHWWEIYKLANRAFARRKIKKEVNKAAKIKPEFVKKSKLLSLSIFLGWFGAHNFYAKNKRKGWFMLVCTILWFGVISLAMNGIPFFQGIELSVGGFAGFLVLTLWISDVINIIFNNFKYRVQKVAFISKLNVETRAKLGEKYIDMDLYQKPWWTRLKVWIEKKRRDYAKFKHERRQRMIEKEKAKQAKLAEQAKIDAEIAEYEKKEDERLKSQKIIDAIDKNAFKEIKSLKQETYKDVMKDNKSSEDDNSNNYSKKKTAKVRVTSKKNKNK